MEYKILDGKFLADLVHKQILSEVVELAVKHKRPPGLAVVLVGNNPASRSYVTRKEKVAKTECGFETFDYFLPEDISESELLNVIKELNLNPAVDGILLQLPLPKHLNQNKFLDEIVYHKDADGLHPMNQGLLQRGDAWLRPCTPLGCLRLIDLAYYNSAKPIEKYSDIPEVDLKGKHAVVIGRSILVGKPVATLLLERNATVTVAHSRTTNIAEIVAQADIVVAAVGVAELVKSDWIKPGAIVIDVGINKTAEGKLVGDVDFINVANNCQAITPVPGGCGPMTVAMLMQNTLAAYKAHV